jgi:predicted flavoprotein YhiN
MKITITLTDENAAIVAQYGELTGFTQEELTNWFLADYFAMFDDEDQSFINETIGSMYFKDRKSAERVQTWLVKRLEKKGYFHDSIETEINSNPDGTFDVRLSVPALWEKGGRHQVT